MVGGVTAGVPIAITAGAIIATGADENVKNGPAVPPRSGRFSPAELAAGSSKR
jgi:hypothetical protein